MSVFRRDKSAFVEAETFVIGGDAGSAKLDDFLFGDETPAPRFALPQVTSETLLNIPAAYDAINAIAFPIKSLPLIFFEKKTVTDGNGQTRTIKERIDDHPVKRRFANPNTFQDQSEFLEYIARALAIHHNQFTELAIDRDGEGVMIPLDPRRTGVEIRGGSLIYFYDDPILKRTRTISADRIWHTKVGPFDSVGLCGIGPLVTNQKTLQAALATIDYGGRFFANDGTPTGGYWKTPNSLSTEALANLSNTLPKGFGGKNQGKTRVVEEGLEYIAVNAPNDKAQFIETKKHDAIEVARIWNMPPHKIKSLDAATYTNIEQQSIEYVVYGLQPWLTSLERSIKRHLIGLDNNVHAEFNVLGLLRGDTAARYSAYAVGRQWGWLSADDVRSLENMNPLPDGQGEIYLTPLNMADAADSEETGTNEDANNANSGNS